MSVRGIRWMAAFVTVVAALALSPGRNAWALGCGTCGEDCLCCTCSAGGNYVCCQWVSGAFNGCANYGHVPGQCNEE